jgi:hypothetical protein
MAGGCDVIRTLGLVSTPLYHVTAKVQPRMRGGCTCKEWLCESCRARPMQVVDRRACTGRQQSFLRHRVHWNSRVGDPVVMSCLLLWRTTNYVATRPRSARMVPTERCSSPAMVSTLSVARSTSDTRTASRYLTLGLRPSWAGAEPSASVRVRSAVRTSGKSVSRYDGSRRARIVIGCVLKRSAENELVMAAVWSRGPPPWMGRWRTRSAGCSSTWTPRSGALHESSVCAGHGSYSPSHVILAAGSTVIRTRTHDPMPWRAVC